MTKKFKDILCYTLIILSLILLVITLILQGDTILNDNYNHFKLNWITLLGGWGLLFIARYLKKNNSPFLNK